MEHFRHFLILAKSVCEKNIFPFSKKTFSSLIFLELNINQALNSRLIPAHMQGQHAAAAAAAVASATASGTASNIGGVNASAAGNSSTVGTSVTTATTNTEKSGITVTASTRVNNSSPPSTVPTASGTTVNGPADSDAVNNLEEPTTTGGDSTNQVPS